MFQERKAEFTASIRCCDRNYCPASDPNAGGDSENSPRGRWSWIAPGI